MAQKKANIALACRLLEQDASLNLGGTGAAGCHESVPFPPLV